MGTTPSNLSALKSWVGSVKSAMKSVKSGKPSPDIAAKAMQMAQAANVKTNAVSELRTIQTVDDASIRKPMLENFLKKYAGQKTECAEAENLLAQARKQITVQAAVVRIKQEQKPAVRKKLCDDFLKSNAEFGKECAEIEDVMAQAWKEMGVEEAKNAYLLQAQGKADPKYNPANQYDLKNLTGKAKTAAKGDLTDVTGSGLSGPEVSAIKTFTADDYKYLNPAVANQKDKADKPSDWMDVNKPTGMSDEDWKKKKKELYEEGALHAGVMMEGLKKMKAQGKMIYRGFRISPADFASKFAVGKALDPTETFQSTSTDEVVAYGFSAGNKKTAADQTTAVVLQAQLFDGRDIEKLSVYKSEKEILTLPGTVYEVISISDMPSGKRQSDPEAPQATAWKIVNATQKFK
jgi:hypothetical protein